MGNFPLTTDSTAEKREHDSLDSILDQTTPPQTGFRLTVNVDVVTTYNHVGSSRLWLLTPTITMNNRDTNGPREQPSL